MTVSTWDEIRTAFHVAKMGTVSGAAEVMGVHHATVIRHIDALEAELGVKLFQRHARGYTATEAGEDLLQVAQATDDQFAQLVGRIRGRGEDVSGELVITSLASMSFFITPILADFQAENPGLMVRFLGGARLFRLEYGEAHVAIRAGAAPQQPDNVVQKYVEFPTALYAAQSYIDRFGAPKDEGELAKHRIVNADNPESRAPFARWIRENVPDEAVVFRSDDDRVLRDAVVAGSGIGFLTCHEAKRYPNLVEVLPPRPEWGAPLWLVTHVDLHRTTKVQALLKFLKDAAKSL